MRNKTAIAGIAIAALVALGCSAGEDDKQTSGPGAQPQPTETGKAPKGRKVVIEVAGAKRASNITYLLDGDTSQDNGVKLPWKKTLVSTDALMIVAVNAQNAGGGKITCKITVDGKVVKQNASTGEYAIVDCNADQIG